MTTLNFLLLWTALTLGIKPDAIPPLTAIQLPYAVMQEAKCGNKPNCLAFPAEYPGDGNLYIAEELNFDNPKAVSYVVHQMTHHLQLKLRYKDNVKSFVKDFEKNENEANKVQMEFLKEAAKRVIS